MDSETSGADYQVFLSFRGPDTRQGFTDCLYHFLVDAGVRVFRDNEEIRAGEKINVILSAINNSKVCIPIFSKGYASSKWCLHELSQMIKLKKIILPVFFDVSPDDVKLKTPLYRDVLRGYEDGPQKNEWEMAFKQLIQLSGWKSRAQAQLQAQAQAQAQAQGQGEEQKQEQGEQEEKQKQEQEQGEQEEEEHEALKEVVKIKGWELNNKGYAELCKCIVEEVLNNLKVRDRIVSDCLVGIDDQVETVHKLLDMKATGVRYVLIHGLGGSGKTTLAKVIFNQLNSSFEHHSFISDVRELSKRHGAKHLQRQLLADCRIPNDDISSSDEGIKRIRQVLPKRKVLIVLDDVDKREQIENLIPSSSSLGPGSRVIVTTRDERVLAFRHELVSTLKMDELDTSRALKIFSMNAFGLSFPPPEYLDLSMEVVSLAENLPLHLEIAGSYLKSKSREEWSIYIAQLRKIPLKEVQEKLMLSYNTLDIRTKQIFLDIACFFVNREKDDAMYMWEKCDLLPEVGIEELTSKSLLKVIDGNKLWMHDFVRDLGREIVCQENLIDAGDRSRLWIHEKALGVLERKEGTRKIHALRLSADEPSKCFTRKHFKNLKNLRFLEWSGPRMEGNFEHIFSKLTWLSWHNCPSKIEAEMLNLVNLVFLDLSGSDITEDWEGWSRGNMGCNLKVLNLTNCKYLTRIPDLSKFSGLERLILNGCSGLTSIDPSIICILKRLKHLNLTGCCSLEGLPEALCRLDALEEIIMVGGGGDQFFSIPESIGDLVKLTVLELSEVRINGLPESVCRLKKLKRLVLYRCMGVTKFPDSFGDLESLAVLDAYECRELSELPDSIGRLKQLKVLNLQWTKIRQLPSTIGMLEQLEELNANHACDLTGAIPSEVGNLSRLKYFDLSYTAIEVLPSLTNLSNLQTLRMIECNKLIQVPELPASVTELEVTSTSVIKVSSDDISLVNSLVYLTWVCPRAGWPWSEESCRQAEYLSRLYIGQWYLTNYAVPRLSTLKNLCDLRLWRCMFGDRFQSLGVGDMMSLKRLHISDFDCAVLKRDCLPQNLERLDLHNGSFLTLLDVSHLCKLKRLETDNCERLKEIIGYDSMCTGAVKIIKNCPSLLALVNASIYPDMSSSDIEDDSNDDVVTPTDVRVDDDNHEEEDEEEEEIVAPKDVGSDMEQDDSSHEEEVVAPPTDARFASYRGQTLGGGVGKKGGHIKDAPLEDVGPPAGMLAHNYTSGYSGYWPTRDLYESYDQCNFEEGKGEGQCTIS